MKGEHRQKSGIRHIFNQPVLLGLYLYRHLVSPLFGAHCRFHPTCSEYARQAFSQYAFFQASYLTLRRITKCHPWNPGGNDPLPCKDKQAQDGQITRNKE